MVRPASLPPAARTQQPAAAPVTAEAGGDPVLAALAEQSRALAAMLDQKDRKRDENGLRSTMRIHPHVEWPMCGDADDDVRAHVEEFEDIIAMASDGRGMAPSERLRTFGQTLKGTKKATFKVSFREARESGRLADEPEKIYEEIKAQLVGYTETKMERQARALREFNSLNRGGLSHQAYQAQWDHALATLTSLSLPRSGEELFLAYIEKIGPRRRADVMKDVREWASVEDASIKEMRKAKTWREASMLCRELDAFTDENRRLGEGLFAVAPSRGAQAMNPGVFAFDRGNGAAKAPADGCWTCGGAHYARDCPQAPAGGKAAGKGGGRPGGGKAGGGRGGGPGGPSGQGGGPGGQGGDGGAGGQGLRSKNKHSCKHCGGRDHEEKLCPKAAACRRDAVNRCESEFTRTGVGCSLCGQGSHRKEHHRLAAQDAYCTEGVNQFGGKAKGKGKGGKGDGHQPRGRSEERWNRESNGGNAQWRESTPDGRHVKLNKPCRLWAAGSCAYGDSCKFSHSAACGAGVLQVQQTAGGGAAPGEVPWTAAAAGLPPGRSYTFAGPAPETPAYCDFEELLEPPSAPDEMSWDAIAQGLGGPQAQATAAAAMLGAVRDAFRESELAPPEVPGVADGATYFCRGCGAIGDGVGSNAGLLCDECGEGEAGPWSTCSSGVLCEESGGADDGAEAGASSQQPTYIVCQGCESRGLVACDVTVDGGATFGGSEIIPACSGCDDEDNCDQLHAAPCDWRAQHRRHASTCHRHAPTNKIPKDVRGACHLCRD
ncbi:MAG TPA: zinc finger CCCH domain-containing protein, partial [Bacteroidetes bacterium]|nr:zinc finger CCCH domain-containing protein [Bacteroidota bacterium]